MQTAKARTAVPLADVRPHKKKRNEEVAIRFGRNLARQRRLARLSQEELGRRASLHRTEIGMLEHGQRSPRIDTIVKLAGALSVEPQALLDGIHWTPSQVSGGDFSFSGWACGVTDLEPSLGLRLTFVRGSRRLGSE